MNKLTIKKSDITCRTYKALYFYRFKQGISDGIIEKYSHDNFLKLPIEEVATRFAGKNNIRKTREKQAFVHGFLCGVLIADYATQCYRENYDHASKLILQRLELMGLFKYIRLDQ